MIPIHDDTDFFGNGVFYGRILKNYGTGTVPANRVVCWFATTADAKGFIQVGRGTVLSGGTAFAKEAAIKVCGITMEAIAAADFGPVAQAAVINCAVTGSPATADLLVLSSTAGYAKSKPGGYVYGSGEVFAQMIGVEAGDLVRVFLFPWRV